MSVTLSELKEHLRITDTNSDTIVQIYLDAALNYIESQTGRKLSSVAGRVSNFDAFGEMEIDGDNPTSVVITYIDSDGSSQTLSDALYEVKTHKAKPYITLAYNASYPSTRAQDAAITVTYTSGYSVSTLPQAIKAAVLLLGASLYEVREEFIIGTSITSAPITVKRLIAPFTLFKT